MTMLFFLATTVIMNYIVDHLKALGKLLRCQILLELDST